MALSPLPNSESKSSLLPTLNVPAAAFKILLHLRRSIVRKSPRACMITLSSLLQTLLHRHSVGTWEVALISSSRGSGDRLVGLGGRHSSAVVIFTFSDLLRSGSWFSCFVGKQECSSSSQLDPQELQVSLLLRLIGALIRSRDRSDSVAKDRT